MTTKDTGPVDLPSSISFRKGEVLAVLDKEGGNWRVRKEDGTVGRERKVQLYVDFLG